MHRRRLLLVRWFIGDGRERREETRVLLERVITSHHVYYIIPFICSILSL